jgi:excisionase family DNA binding protein
VPKQTQKRGSLENLTSELISVTEASRRSGLSVSHIRKLLSDGQIEGVKVGRNWLTTEEAIQEYLKQERRPGPKSKRER